MITEYYVSYEIAKMLKEKGFNERSIASYDSKGQLQEGYGYWNKTPIWCAAPTHQMAMAWLREMHGIFIAINNDDLDFNWQCCDLINRASTLDPKILSESYAGYKTYEEAVEAALKYVLENLI